MTYRRRALALVIIVLLVSAACSKPKTQVAQSGGAKKGAPALSSNAEAPGGDAAAKAGVPRPVAVNGPAAKGYAAINPAADVAQAKKIGELIKLQSTSYKTPNTWTGVTRDTIKLNFGVDADNCGVNIVQLLSNASANLGKATRFYRKAPADQTTINAEDREAIATLVRYWNDHVDDVAKDIPQAVQVMKKYNKPGRNFYGRRITYDIIDAGSFQCQDKQTSAALQMRDQTKPFSAVVYDVPGLVQNGVSLAAAMKAKIPANKRSMIFGLLDTSDYYLSQFAPYAWNEFQSATKMSKLGASWICSDLKGTGPGAKLWGSGKAINASGTTTTGTAYKSTTRKFGLIYANNPNSNRAAVEFKNFIKSGCGITFDRNTTEFQIDDNPARAPDQGNQIATRFKVNNITTVIYLIDFLGAFFHIVDFKNQNYRPEFAEIGTAWQTNTVQRLSPAQDMVDRASMFYTAFGVQGLSYGPGDPFWTYHAYHKVSPRTKRACDPRSDAGMDHDQQYCKAPGAVINWYYSWLPLAVGLIISGPTVTPGTISAGLQAYPLTRYGADGPTSDPVAVLVGAGPGQYYFITDGSSSRWRAAYVSPPPEQQLGFFDAPDCQRHYLSWPNKLAPQWEKGGANYNAWCGAAKYTQNWKDPATGKPLPYQPSASSGQSCGDTPSRTCERDNYPRWQPILYR